MLTRGVLWRLNESGVAHRTNTVTVRVRTSYRSSHTVVVTSVKIASMKQCRWSLLSCLVIGDTPFLGMKAPWGGTHRDSLFAAWTLSPEILRERHDHD